MSTKGKRRERAAAREAKAYRPLRGTRGFEAMPREPRLSDVERDRDWRRYDEHSRNKEDR